MVVIGLVVIVTITGFVVLKIRAEHNAWSVKLNQSSLRYQRDVLELTRVADHFTRSLGATSRSGPGGDSGESSSPTGDVIEQVNDPRSARNGPVELRGSRAIAPYSYRTLQDNVGSILATRGLAGVVQIRGVGLTSLGSPDLGGSYRIFYVRAHGSHSMLGSETNPFRLSSIYNYCFVLHAESTTAVIDGWERQAEIVALFPSMEFYLKDFQMGLAECALLHPAADALSADVAFMRDGAKKKRLFDRYSASTADAVTVNPATKHVRAAVRRSRSVMT